MHFQTRDLAKSKAIRDRVAKDGLSGIIQKRVIIAPPMEGTAAEEVTLQPPESAFQPVEPARLLCYEKRESGWKNLPNKVTLKSGDSVNLHQLNSDYLEYKSWLNQERRIRCDLKKMQDIDGWLKRKKDLSELESRVFVRSLPPIESISSITEATEEEPPPPSPDRSPPPLPVGQARLLPLLQQPLPVALAAIDFFLQSKRIRLIDLFTQTDKDKNWALNRDEIRRIVTETGIPFTLAQIDDLIIALDIDNNEHLTYKELAIGLEAYRIDTRWQRILQVFSQVREEHEVKLQEKASMETIPVRGQQTSWLFRSPDNSPSVSFSNSNTSGLHDGSTSDVTSSGSLLQVPSLDMTEKVEESPEKLKEKRLRKQQQKKEKRARHQRKKAEKVSHPLSTMSKPVGPIKDHYFATQFDQMNNTLDACHTKGVALKKELFERVFMIPPDKPKEKIHRDIRQPGTHLISSQQLDDLCRNDESSDDGNGSCGSKDRQQYRGESDGRGRSRRRVDVFWPQSLLDKLRLCDDSPVPKSKTQSIFYTVP